MFSTTAGGSPDYPFQWACDKCGQRGLDLNGQTACKQCVQAKPQLEWACDECSATFGTSSSTSLSSCYTCVKDQPDGGPTAWA